MNKQILRKLKRDSNLRECPDCHKLIFISTRAGGRYVHLETGAIPCHPDK